MKATEKGIFIYFKTAKLKSSDQLFVFKKAHVREVHPTLQHVATIVAEIFLCFVCSFTFLCHPQPLTQIDLQMSINTCNINMYNLLYIHLTSEIIFTLLVLQIISEF